MATPTLIRAQISFNTGDDGKDGDTGLTITINRADGGEEVAILTGQFGVFNAHASTQLFFPILTDAKFLAGEHGTLTIAIDPVGHDTWRFDCFMELIFSDASRHSLTFLGHALNQNTRSNTFPFNVG